MIKTRQHYSKEFKQRAVELFESGTLSTKELADQLGIHPNLLYKWHVKSQSGKQEPFPGNGRQSPEDEELRQLRRENADLKMERDILKKAISIFSQESK